MDHASRSAHRLQEFRTKGQKSFADVGPPGAGHPNLVDENPTTPLSQGCLSQLRHSGEGASLDLAMRLLVDP
jgi:hypothetical protein